MSDVIVETLSKLMNDADDHAEKAIAGEIPCPTPLKKRSEKQARLR
jgi:hypothetical protein